MTLITLMRHPRDKTLFLLSTDYPDLTEAETRARTSPMRSKNQ